MLKCASFKFSLLICALLVNLACAQHKTQIHAPKGMVVCAEPLAAKVGLQVLKKGGNAVDAAVAVGFALAVTYPTAGNIGGGGYMVARLKDGRVFAIDYREKAPAASSKDMYLDPAGKVNNRKIQIGETAAGVPGSVAGMLYALEKYGTMKRADVIAPAVNLAESGFQLSGSTALSLSKAKDDFSKFQSSINVFTKNGQSYSDGEIFKQPDLAKTLKLISTKGREGFYEGETAELIAKQMKSTGGYISAEDLKNYLPVEREPLKGTYRGYDIISMPPSSSGGIALIEMLNILENFQFKKEDWGGSDYYHKLVSAMKFAYADRSEHLGDPDFYKVPVDWLTSKAYAKELAAKIKNDAVTSSKILPGKPRLMPKESTQTTHYSVIDKDGNCVSVTTTLNSEYGCKVVVDGAGFLLNNEMDDFSAKPGVPNQFGLIGGLANAIEPGKRMLSSMTPTIVLKDGKPYMIVGTPGGSTIITCVLQVITNCIDFGMNLTEAVHKPRIHHQWLPDKIDFEENSLIPDVKSNLAKKGYTFGSERVLGLVEAIMYDPVKNVYYGVSDPRGHGAAEGY